ncbi:MAG: PPC domain-containing protein, partial [Flavobacteriales bacterium]|nr:PPC domain-containing protein [Flavobacteriales bacterium]
MRLALLAGVISMHVALFNSQVHAQCPFNNSLYTDLTPTGVGNTQTSTCTFGGEYNTFTACAGAEYTISTCGDTDFDTQLSVYEPNGTTVAAYNDDGCGLQSTVTFTATVAGLYSIMLDQYNCISNSLCMTMTVTQNTACSGGCSDCSNATNVTSIPFTLNNASTCGACDNFSSGNGCSSSYLNGDDYVFTYTPSANELINIDLTGTGTWTGLFVMDGCPTAAPSCVAMATESSGNPSLSNVSLTGGVTYYIVVSTWPAPQCTDFNISITQGINCSDCSNPTVIGTIPFSMSGLTTCGACDNFDSFDACASNYLNGEDYVFSYTPSAAEVITVDLTSTGTYSGVFIFDGCPSTAGTNCLASATSSAGNESVSSPTLTAGITYYIVVSTWPAPDCIPFDISVSSGSGPINQFCSTAIDICNPTVLTGTTNNAQNEPLIDPPISIWSCNAVYDNYVFYTFTSDSVGSTVVLDMTFNCGGSYLQTAIFDVPPNPCENGALWDN